MTPRRALWAMVLLLVLPPHAWAGAPTDALRDAITAVNRALDDAELRKSPADLRAAMRAALVPRIDAREAARLSLGNEWMARTPAEREEFTTLFGDHFERTYVFRIAAHAPMHRPLAVRYIDEKSDGRTATVATAIGNREGGEVPVDYRLIQRNGRWAIYDVAIDGASLVDNYKTLFSRVIAQSSFADVIALMKPRSTGAAATKPVDSRPGATAPSLAAGTDATGTSMAPAPAVAAPAQAVATPTPAPAPLVTIPPPVPAAETLTTPGASRGATSATPGAPTAASAPMPATPEPVAKPGAPAVAKLVADHAATVTAAPPISVTPTAATPTPPPAPSTAYWLQVGAFKNPDAASGLAARLRAQKLPVSIDPVTVPAGRLSRVRVGPFADQAEATAKLRQLETSGYRPFLAVERTSN